MAGENYVIDPSVAVKWYIPEDYSDLAIILLKKFEKPNVKIYAPSLFKVEFSNVIRKYLIRELLDEDVAKEILEEVKKLPVIYMEMTWERIERAFLYATKKNLTLYDALYIIIAKEVGGKIITADKKVLNATTDDDSVVSIIDLTYPNSSHE